jgi:deoxyribonuclease-4
MIIIAQIGIKPIPAGALATACYTVPVAGLIFGTAGIPISTQPQTTVDGIRRIAELGLGAMEVEFVQGVYLNEEKARQIAAVARGLNVELSVHAPYFINLNAREDKKTRMGQSILRRTAHIAGALDAHSVVFHAGFYMGDAAEEAYQTIKQRLSEVLARLKAEGICVTLRPEVSGRQSQFGSLEEVLRLCKELPGLQPTIDFAHWHARSGGFNSYAEFTAILEQMRGELGDDALEDVHFHIAGIAYGDRGERKHLNLKESDLKYGELLKALADSRVSGVVICESPNREEDTLLLKAGYRGNTAGADTGAGD